MKIAIRCEGEVKEFTQDFIAARMYRRTLEMQKLLGKKLDADSLDEMVDYVVAIYGKQFTRDEFYDGVDARQILNEVISCVDQVNGAAMDAVGVDPNAPK